MPEGGGESQGDCEDGRFDGGAGLADREKQIVLKEGWLSQLMDSGPLVRMGGYLEETETAHFLYSVFVCFLFPCNNVP